jgi:hypothetical protein
MQKQKIGTISLSDSEEGEGNEGIESIQEFAITGTDSVTLSP